MKNVKIMVHICHFLCYNISIKGKIMANKIKYIIDYKGYGDIFDLTITRTGEHNEITREQAEDYLPIAMGDNADSVYFTFRADEDFPICLSG